ncbi:oxalurate catabolism protein HpxZ [Acidiphilium acidophilum]|uniref:oxalurate catabolism protein HpxZ n=1 Tax=Acidiphilium acidophilum TaxID=76588 RepID=UPI002E8E64D6|nr:oxalurate catabolism protein HpxZ [Acidiphilium acidophilum]
MSDVEINLPEVHAELSAIFDRYERALIENDIDVLNELFWQSDHTIRYGISENLHGFSEIAEYRRRVVNKQASRSLGNTVITTFGNNFGTVNTEFIVEGGRGRQSQTWMRLNHGWRIVAAHVSMPVSHDSASEQRRSAVADNTAQ